ncbi:MAG: hydroxyacid dehydrogenase [Acidimicrobiia bacterium]|nr:hydroxyacid dehydrogenase [Acidimicrobiia bacterium]
MAAPRVALAPDGAPGWVARAITDGGGVLVEPAEADALVWFGALEPERLAPVLDEAAGARWVQLPWAGVEPYASLIGPDRTWTCGKGVYAEPVAEHALGLMLAGLRDLPERVRAERWGRQGGVSLYGGKVTVLGGGGITEALLGLLAPFRCEVTVVRRSSAAMAGTARVVGLEALHEVLPGADAVVLALAFTPETIGLIGAGELALMEGHAWLVNVARGGHVVTDDLVAALRERSIGGAALDVTEPEPLPDGHPLWGLSNCLITPHTANTLAMARPHLVKRIRENVRRFAAGEELIGLVDPELGY